MESSIVLVCDSVHFIHKHKHINTNQNNNTHTHKTTAKTKTNRGKRKGKGRGAKEEMDCRFTTTYHYVSMVMAYNELEYVVVYLHLDSSSRREDVLATPNT